MGKAESSVLYHRNKRFVAKLMGHCTKCYNEKSVDGKLRCIGCLERQRVYNKSKSAKASRKKYYATPKGKAKVVRQNKRAAPRHAADMRKWRLKNNR